MKNNLADALKTSIIERRATRPTMVATTEAFGGGNLPYSAPSMVRTATTAEFRFFQTGPEEAITALHKRAVRAILREVYGGVYEDLHRIIHALWDDGIYRSKAEELITTLMGELIDDN